ncbi:hypothetical protein Mal52_30480 [Symmachiella dynata]|uniref:Uncharacterized protein n=1 Tax=Symmachiella dynata TaxID=2527995 RepID=A0A517ZQ07_9PLAN|nr:helix-turn-helix domain-containing protein [Symmachiella dynata]QDU44564.1 hypothetical protein Mal52_30480 [Symmachiella dynata]
MGRTPQEEMQIQHRRQEVAEMYLQGSTQAAIARQLAVSQATVSNDLKAIRQDWKESGIRDFEEAVGQELHKLQLLEREAWDGWRRSQLSLETTRVTQTGSDKKAEKSSRQQHGDPRFLELVQRTISSRRSLLGLDAPTRIAPTSPDGDEAYDVHVLQKLFKLAEETPVGPTVIDAEFLEQQLSQIQEKSETNPPPETKEHDNDC